MNSPTTKSSHPTADDLRRWDQAFLWHPFTQMREWMAETPLLIERGEGNYLYDTEGNRYFDGSSSLWCNVHGHGRPEIVESISDQARRVAHSTLLGLANVPSTLLAKKLIEIAPPGLQRVFYSDAGATAVEAALKMAFAYWQYRGQPGRDLFVSLNEGYHGDTLGSLSVGYLELFDRPYRPLLFPCLKINPPHIYRYYRRQSMDEAVRSALQEAEQVLSKDRRRIAAIVVEPLMQAAAVMWNHPVEYLAGLHRICRGNDILMIADEVAVGFGRTGRMFACDHAAITPDLMCLAKGLSGGTLPLAATLATEEIFSAFLGEFEEGKAFYHGHTYCGNPVACAAALASIDIFERDEVLKHVQERAAELKGLLSGIAGLPHVADIRQWGLMAGIELVEDVATRKPFPASRRTGKKVILEARKRGILLRPLNDVVILMPPLSTTQEELRTLVSVVADSILAATHSASA